MPIYTKIRVDLELAQSPERFTTYSKMRDIVAYFNSMLKHPNNDIKHTKGTVTVQNDIKTNKKQSLIKVINSLHFSGLH